MTAADPYFDVEDVWAAYDEADILTGVSMAMDQGDAVSLIGRNGAGKTTTLRTVMGVIHPHRGSIVFKGEEISGLADHATARRGLGFIPENREIFPDLTVEENIVLGGVSSGDSIYSLEELYDLFPRLEERKGQRGSHLSGGEQQMLAIARALHGQVSLLMLDEPTEGLAPQIVTDVVDIIKDIKQLDDVSILIVEQNLHVAMEVADRHYILDRGEIVFEGTTDELAAAEEVQRKHLGVETSAGI